MNKLVISKNGKEFFQVPCGKNNPGAVLSFNILTGDGGHYKSKKLFISEDNKTLDLKIEMVEEVKVELKEPIKCYEFTEAYNICLITKKPFFNPTVIQRMTNVNGIVSITGGVVTYLGDGWYEDKREKVNNG